MRCYSRRFFGFIEIAAEAKYRDIFPQMKSKGTKYDPSPFLSDFFLLFLRIETKPITEEIVAPNSLALYEWIFMQPFVSFSCLYFY